MCWCLPWRKATALGQVALEFSCRGQQETKVWRRRFDRSGGELWMILHSNKVTVVWNQKIAYYCTFLLPQASFKQQRLNVWYHNEGQFGVKHDFSTSCSRIVCIRRSRWVLDFKHTFPIPSNSMTSIRSPSTSWPTNWSPFCSKWCFSSGFTWNKIRFCDPRFYFLFCSCSTSRRKAMGPTKQNNVQIKSQS